MLGISAPNSQLSHFFFFYIVEDVRKGLAQLEKIKQHFATAPHMSVTDSYGNEMYSNGEVDRWLETGSRILGMKGIQRGY